MLSCGALLRAENEDAFLHLNLEELSEEAEDEVMFDTGIIFGSVEETVKELHSFSIQRCGPHSLALAIANSYDEYSITILENARRVVKRILYTFQKLHFPEKHVAETTLSRIYISLNVHFPEITFP